MVEILFGTTVDGSPGRELRRALVEAVDALESLPLPAAPGTGRLPLPANRRFERARDRLDSLMSRMVAERRTAPGRHADLLAAIAWARGADGRAMEDRQVRDEALSLFRGHRTAGTALCWTWYLLSRHPGVEARVLEEIDSVLGDRLPGADDVPRLQYCGMVVAESMRLFPPAWIMVRRAVAEHEVGGYAVPVGTTVLVSPYVVHRDPRLHAEPRRFDPERFAPDRRGGWHPFAYFPFGGGSKRCLGDELARFEAVLLMAVVGRTWRLREAPGHRVEPAPRATLKPRFGLKVIPERRAPS
jgi:cytochrome P450